MALDPKNLNIVLLIDKSSSMAYPNKQSAPAGPTRWQAVEELTQGLAREFGQYDDDGIDVVFFSGEVATKENVTTSQVPAVFASVRPAGSTNTAGALAAAFKKHFDRKAKNEPKSTMVVCVTDGTPDNEDAVRAEIVAASKKVNSPDDLSICFIQAGDDAKAEAFLKGLDERIPGAKFDLVKSMPAGAVEQFATTDALIAAILEH